MKLTYVATYLLTYLYLAEYDSLSMRAMTHLCQSEQVTHL